MTCYRVIVPLHILCTATAAPSRAQAGGPTTALTANSTMIAKTVARRIHPMKTFMIMNCLTMRSGGAAVFFEFFFSFANVLLQFQTALADALRPSELKVCGASPKLELLDCQQGCKLTELFVREDKAGPLWFGYLHFPRFPFQFSRGKYTSSLKPSKSPSQARIASIVNMHSAARWVAQ